MNLSLHNVESISFDAWTDESFIITEPREIFVLGIEILSAETNNLGQIIIHTHCDNSPNDSFDGGQLIIKCSDYNLTDQENNSLTIEKLKELSEYYWSEKGRK